MKSRFNNPWFRHGAMPCFIAGFVAMSLTQTAAATNYAQQFDLANCGAYSIKRFGVERRADDTNGNWKSVYLVPKDVATDRAICIDVSGIKDDNDEPVFGEGDEVRIVAHIAGGERVRCDSTNFPNNDSVEPSSGEDEDHRRRLVMKGTSFNNNGCRSIEYRDVLPQHECRTWGAVRSISC